MRVSTFIASTVFVAGVIVFAVPQFRSETIEILSYSECDTPMSYKLGTLDQKFGLSQTRAVADIQNAVDIWSKTYGKTLYINSPGAALTVNFVYDQRSALNAQIGQLEKQLDQKNTTLQQQISSYEADVATFKQKLAAFNAQVDQLNRSGGAPPDVYDRLMAQQNEIKAEGDALNVRAGQLNLASNDFNAKVRNLNQNVSQFNQDIVQKPEEGLYNGNDNTVTIYFADNHQELIHTLAHEFGHALGMQHTDDHRSLMYPYTTSFLSITPQDKQQLAYVCREQLLPGHWLQEFATWLRLTVNTFAPN